MAGVVYRDAIYRVSAIRQAMGWGRVSWRAARRRGLRVLRLGRNSYVLGVDVMAYIEAQAREVSVDG
jgi:hypothetical protein